MMTETRLAATVDIVRCKCCFGEGEGGGMEERWEEWRKTQGIGDLPLFILQEEQRRNDRESGDTVEK
jgi:hypothetical protein